MTIQAFVDSIRDWHPAAQQMLSVELCNVGRAVLQEIEPGSTESILAFKRRITREQAEAMAEQIAVGATDLANAYETAHLIDPDRGDRVLIIGNAGMLLAATFAAYAQPGIISAESDRMIEELIAGGEALLSRPPEALPQ